MAARTRGYGITKADMEANRLVFVFLRDSKPRRKVAVPVPDNYTWDLFINQVKLKLKLTGVGDIFLASTGQKIRGLDELQDIDELCVVEAPPEQNGTLEAALRSGVDVSTSEIMPSAAESMLRTEPSRHKVAAADGASSSAPEQDDEQKYARRIHPLRLTLQRLLPSLFQPGLPVTTKDLSHADADSSRPGRKRRRRSPLDARNLLLILAVASCLGTMLFLFLRLSSAPGNL